MKKPGCIYVFAAGSPFDGLYKIGKSTKPLTRLSRLTKMPFDMKVVHMVDCDEPSLVESELHKFFSEKRKTGEWFLLEDKDVAFLTECNSQVALLDAIGYRPPETSNAKKKQSLPPDCKQTVFSERKTKDAARAAGLTLDQINAAAGLGTGYISRKWGSGKIEFSTLNRIARVIGCSAIDLIEEINSTNPLIEEVEN